MSVARLIVFEKRGFWAAALRRELGRGPIGESASIRDRLADDEPEIELRETRSLDECWSELALFPGSFLVLELTPTHLEPVILRLAGLFRSHVQARALVVGERALEHYREIALEAGAVWAFFSPRDMVRMTTIIRHHFNGLPETPRTLRERVMTAIPW